MANTRLRDVFERIVAAAMERPFVISHTPRSGFRSIPSQLQSAAERLDRHEHRRFHDPRRQRPHERHGAWLRKALITIGVVGVGAVGGAWLYEVGSGSLQKDSWITSEVDISEVKPGDLGRSSEVSDSDNKAFNQQRLDASAKGPFRHDKLLQSMQDAVQNYIGGRVVIIANEPDDHDSLLGQSTSDVMTYRGQAVCTVHIRGVHSDTPMSFDSPQPQDLWTLFVVAHELAHCAGQDSQPKFDWKTIDANVASNHRTAAGLRLAYRRYLGELRSDAMSVAFFRYIGETRGLSHRETEGVAAAVLDYRAARLRSDPVHASLGVVEAAAGQVEVHDLVVRTLEGIASGRSRAALDKEAFETLMARTRLASITSTDPEAVASFQEFTRDVEAAFLYMPVSEVFSSIHLTDQHWEENLERARSQNEVVEQAQKRLASVGFSENRPETVTDYVVRFASGPDTNMDSDPRLHDIAGPSSP